MYMYIYVYIYIDVLMYIIIFLPKCLNIHVRLILRERKIL